MAKILEKQGLKAIRPKSFQPRTPEGRHLSGYSPSLLPDEFVLRELNQLWVVKNKTPARHLFGRHFSAWG